MSVYATFDETAGEQIATNGGWASFCVWAREVPILKRFVDTGIGTPSTVLEALRTAGAPPDPDTAHVIAGLDVLLNAHVDEEVVFITDGMGP